MKSSTNDDRPWDEAKRAQKFDEIERLYAKDNPVPVMVPTKELLDIIWT